MVEELYKYVIEDYDIFLTQSLYDGIAIDQVLGIRCALETTLSECKEQDRQVIDKYYENVTALVKKIANKKEDNGAFGIACVEHDLVKSRWAYIDFTVPMATQNTAASVMMQWAKNLHKPTIYIDEVQWPNNKPCAKKVPSVAME